MTRGQARIAKIRAEHAMVVPKPTAFGRPHRRASPRALPPHDEPQHHPALITLGIGAFGAVGYVMVASAQTRRRFREAQARYGDR